MNVVVSHRLTRPAHAPRLGRKVDINQIQFALRQEQYEHTLDTRLQRGEIGLLHRSGRAQPGDGWFDVVLVEEQHADRLEAYIHRRQQSQVRP